MTVTPHPKGNIPVGESPYFHDPINVGADLGTLLMDNRIPADTVEIMGYNTFDKSKRQFCIIDKTTGERWVVTL